MALVTTRDYWSLQKPQMTLELKKVSVLRTCTCFKCQFCAHWYHLSGFQVMPSFQPCNQLARRFYFQRCLCAYALCMSVGTHVCFMKSFLIYSFLQALELLKKFKLFCLSKLLKASPNALIQASCSFLHSRSPKNLLTTQFATSHHYYKMWVQFISPIIASPLSPVHQD